MLGEVEAAVGKVPDHARRHDHSQEEHGRRGGLELPIDVSLLLSVADHAFDLGQIIAHVIICSQSAEIQTQFRRLSAAASLRIDV